MLKRRTIYVGALLLSFLTAHAQVNLQTGSAVFSLPMFNWKDDKSRLNSLIALNYNSGNGLKVNDVASDVGQGWNLVAGGVITRMQVGEPDDQPEFLGTSGTGKSEDITKYPAGSLYAPVPAENGCPGALTRYPIYGNQGQLYSQHNSTGEDRELDYFSFQFNGKTGLFILNTADADLGVPLGDTKMKISFQRDPTMQQTQGIRTTITSFTIQDVDGLIYKFTVHGLTRILKSHFTDPNLTAPQTEPKIVTGGVYNHAGFDQGPTGPPWINNVMAYPFIINSWYLSEIDDPLTGRKISIGYTAPRLINNSAGADISLNFGTHFSSQNPGPNIFVTIDNKTSVSQTPAISSIAYPDGHIASFSYSTTPRADLNGDFPLAAVDISYLDRGQYRHLSQYQLTTSYFIKNRYGTPNSPYQSSMARLCLRSVRKIGVDLKEDTPPYIFDYYLGSSASDDYVPPPFFYAKDIWGFYNGNNSVDGNGNIIDLTTPLSKLNFGQLNGLCFFNGTATPVLNPKTGYAQNGLLKEIIYPTGGALTYQYVQNTGTFIGSTGSGTVGGVHVGETSSTDGGYSSGCNNPITTQYNYVMNGPGSASSLWGLEQPSNAMVSNNYYAEEYVTWHWSFPSCVFTCCKWHYIYPGILSQDQVISLEGIQELLVAIAPYLDALSVIGDALDVINVFLDPTPAAVAAIVVDIIVSLAEIFDSCQRYTDNNPNTIYYNFDLHAVSPLPAQFKRVEIVESSGSIGKTVEEFTSSDDYPIWYSSDPSFSAKQRYAPWAYGLIKRVSVYDVNGNLIKQTQNIYDTTYVQEPVPIHSLYYRKFSLPIVCLKCQVNNNYSQRNVDWSNPAFYDAQPFQTATTPDMFVDFYNLYTGRMQLDTTYERTYRVSDASQFVQAFTSYKYNNVFNFEVNQINTSQSNGNIISKNISYSSDYSGGALTTLVNNNIVSQPVETMTYLYTPAGLAGTLGENVTEFTQLSTGDIRPARVLDKRVVQPTTLAPYEGPTLTNYASYNIPETYTYDINGNLTGLTDEGGRVETNIYDYNDKYVVASIINADPSVDKCAYSSFESMDLSRSGWAISGISTSFNTNTPSPTGSGNLALLGGAQNSLTASALNTAKPYTLSLWSTGIVTVSGGASLIKSAPTINGFTYYEYNIPQGVSSITVSNTTSANFNIDELRLYPSSARMHSTTYDPLIGKTSECDENNRTTYYTYDNLGRLQFMEDENRNIIKAYEYNNVSTAKQGGCPATYYNHLVSETFSRKNCGAGFLGGNVTYSIPANRYSSTISQFDADIQADIDLLTNGVNYANLTGTCTLLYYNVFQSQSFTSQSCGEGYLGGSVTYSIPAGRYSSIISQADADQQALTEIAANGQAYANDPLNAVCTVDPTPDWEFVPGGTSYCQSVNGALPPHLFALFTDMNPNSPTYNQTQWEDIGPQTYCPAGNYYNVQQSASFNKNNCVNGGGSSVTYTVAPGVYSSTISQAAADQLATNDITANAQNYANANGTCCVPSLIFANGFVSQANSTSLSGTTVSFTWAFTFSPGGATSFQLGTIPTTCCWPTGTRTIPFIQGSTSFTISISTSGVVTLQIVSGPTPSGIGFSGTYDLNLNAFYSAAASGSYTRTCGSGQTGSSVLYSVPQYKYHSLISQPDADQQATNDVIANGQNYANANGTCTTNCTFTFSVANTNHSSTITSGTTTGSFNIAFVPSTNGYTGGTVGTITGGCMPSATRFLTVTDQSTPSRTWNVTITSAGVVSISLASGAAATNNPPPIVLIGTYNL